MNAILRAPLWLLLIGVLLLTAAACLLTNQRGRALLRRILKGLVRPALGLFAAELGGAFVGAMVIALSYAPPGAASAKLGGLVGIFFFGVLFALPIIFCRFLPVLLLLWIPLWAARNRFPAFWRWRCAPVVGGVLNLVAAELFNRVSPLYANPNQHWNIMQGFYAGAVASGVCMFAVGCIRLSRRGSPPANQASPAGTGLNPSPAA